MKIDQEVYELAFFNNFRRGVCTMFDDYGIAYATMDVIKRGIPGAIVELGCNMGESAKVIENVLKHKDPERSFYVYDSFQGLPAPNKEMGDTWAEGQLLCSKEDLIANFEKNELRLPIIVEGWFKDATVIPDQVAFAFFDGDLYDSIMDSFKLIWPVVQPGGLVAVHDYFGKTLAGVRRATDEYLKDKGYFFRYVHKDDQLGNDITIIQKHV